MMLAQLCHCDWISLQNCAQQILSLMFKLIEVGVNRKVTIVKLLRHDGPPSWSCPGSAAAGEKEVRENLEFNKSLRWTRSYPRTGGVLHAGSEYTARGGVG